MPCKPILAACVCVATAACSGGGSTPGKVTLKGQLLSSASAKQSEPLLLAMGWYPTFAGTAPGSPVGAVITQANIQFQGNFPVDFTFSLTGAPPAAALFDLSKTGGTGHLAYGVLIAFRDVNKNGAFDENSAGGAEGDVIAGISVPDPSQPPPEHSYFVVYLDGKPAANDYYSAFPLQQGYNLMEIHYDFGIDPVPLTTSISIPITGSPALNLYACQAAFQEVGWFKRACGIDPYGGTWQAQGSVFSSPTGTQAQLFVNDADGNVTSASISFDGALFRYDSAGQSYNFITSELQGTHSLSFAVPGRASEALPFTLPGAVTVSSPSPNQSFPSGSTVAISWSAAAGTAYYDVYFLADDGSGDWLFHTITGATSATTPPITYVGPAHLSVKAIGPLATGSQGSFVTPISQASVKVSFTH
jgi:hypothetical protein